MSYSHLSTTERFTLSQYRTTDKLTMEEVATQMKRSKSTFSRELRRNSIDGKLYLPDTAQSKMQTRRAQSKHQFMSISESTLEQVKQRLEQYYSPQQLSGRLKREGLDTVSHETIYKMIYTNHQELGTYQPYLRQSQKKRRRRKGVNSKRGVIPGRMGATSA